MSAIFIPMRASVASFLGIAEGEDLLSQQGMYAADFQFALRHSVPVVRDMLDSIPGWYHSLAHEGGKELNIDIRVHDLEVGDYPASPGWHVDAAQREISFENNAKRTDVEASLVGTISTHPDGVSNTVFAQNVVELEGDYDSLTANNNRLLQENLVGVDLDAVRTEDGVWTLFDPYTIHNVEPSRNSGVRLFVRVSVWKKPEGHVPGLTRTEQVYRLR